MAKRRQRINVTHPKYYMGSDMVYHADTADACGAVFKHGQQYTFNIVRYRGTSTDDGSAHTLAWAKRMVRKGLGGSW